MRAAHANPLVVLAINTKLFSSLVSSLMGPSAQKALQRIVLCVNRIVQKNIRWLSVVYV